MIRFANKDDIDDIMSFIDEYWKKGHILGSNKSFFLYEHVLNDEVTFVISLDDVSLEINAILGYIPYGEKHRDVMTVMWKANHSTHASLGLELFKYLRDYGDVRIIASPGSNPELRPLYKYLGYEFGKMIQWYRLNPKSVYQIADIKNPEIPQINSSCNYKSLDSWEEFCKYYDFEDNSSRMRPYKEAWYIRKRYYEHPIYKYMAFGLEGSKGIIKMVLFFRIENCKNINILRLVDSIGDYSYLKNSTALIDKLLEKYDAEYIDCYEIGLPDFYFETSGWKKTEGSGNIIPNYFAPYVLSNIDIYYFSTDSDIVLFKGDGDQDRPN